VLNNDPNNIRQTFSHPLSLFFFKAFVEHSYQPPTRDMSPAAKVGRPPQILEPVAGAKASRQPLCVTGSLRIMTQKLFRFSHFGIPFL
jgi:hypothetical protein